MIIFGASGHSKVVLDIIFANNQTVDVIVDHHPKVSELFGIRVTCNDEIDAKEESDFSSLSIRETNSFILTYDDSKVTIDLPLIL